jgi:Mg-chelatase subunit ChlD
LRFGGDGETIDDNRGQMRVIEALIACLLLIGGLSAATYLSRVSVSVEDNSIDEAGENIFDVLCDSDVVHRIMEGGDFTEAQLKTLISTLLPPSSVFAVYFGSSMTNETLLNATNMGSGSYSSNNAFSGYGTYTISLPLSQGENQSVDVMLVMDVSGSMGEHYNSTHTKLDLAKYAAKTFVDKLNMSRDRIGLASFSTGAALDCHLTNDTVTINFEIDGLNANGYTNMGGGICKSNEEFVAFGRHDAVWVMILLSDGVANYYYNENGEPVYDSTVNQTTSGQYAAQYAIGQAECAKILLNKGVIIYTIGLGSEYLDENLLKQIASDESKYYNTPTAGQLCKIYEMISLDIRLQVRYDIVVIQLYIQGSG